MRHWSRVKPVLPLRPHELVEPGDRFFTVDSDLAIRWSRPTDAQCVATLAEEALDVLGLVAEGISRGTPDVGALTLDRRDPGAVAMDQTPDERLAVCCDDFLLPWREIDRPQMLAAWAVLGEETRPMLRPHRDIDAVAVASRTPPRCLVRKDCLERSAALVDDAGVGGVKSDAKRPDSPMICGNAPVAKVKPEEVGIGTCRKLRKIVVAIGMPVTLRSLAEPTFSSAPPRNRSPGDASDSRNFLVAVPLRSEAYRFEEFSFRSHLGVVGIRTRVRE